MNVLRRAFFLCLFIAASQFLVACNSSSGTQPYEIATVRNAIISEHGQEGGFDALMAAFSKGYSLRQIVAAAVSGRLERNGDLSNSSGGTILPAESITGTVTQKDLQVLIESRFITLSDDFFDEIGVDFTYNLNPIDVPLELRETGHSVLQIFNGIDLQNINFNQDLNAFGIQDDSLEFILDSLNRQGVTQLLNTPKIIGSNEDNEQNESNTNDPITANDILINVTPTTIEANHIVGQTNLPQRFGSFVINNFGTDVVQLEIGPTNEALTLSENGTLLLGGSDSLTVDVDFNGKSQVPFLGEIPVIGRLFRNSQASEAKKNLIIFVTANIVKQP